MKNLISKEIIEFKTKDEHLNEKISATENSLVYHEKLIELSKRTASGFSVEGELPLIELKFGKFNWIFATLFFIFLSFFIAGAFKNLNEPLFIFFPFLIICIAVLHAKYGNTTNKITIDCIEKNLIIENNHWLGKYLVRKNIIPFSKIDHFETKLKIYRSNRGSNHKKYRVILNTKSKKYSLFEIPFGPIYYINEKIMIQAILGIVKNVS